MPRDVLAYLPHQVAVDVYQTGTSCLNVLQQLAEDQIGLPRTRAPKNVEVVESVSELDAELSGIGAVVGAGEVADGVEMIGVHPSILTLNKKLSKAEIVAYIAYFQYMKWAYWVV